MLPLPKSCNAGWISPPGFWHPAGISVDTMATYLIQNQDFGRRKIWSENVNFEAKIKISGISLNTRKFCSPNFSSTCFEGWRRWHWTAWWCRHRNFASIHVVGWWSGSFPRADYLSWQRQGWAGLGCKSREWHGRWIEFWFLAGRRRPLRGQRSLDRRWRSAHGPPCHHYAHRLPGKNKWNLN